MKKLIALVLSLLLLLCCFAGCLRANDDDDDFESPKKSTNKKETSDDNDKSDQDEEAPPKVTPVVVVGYTLYAPYNYYDETGELVGFDTELAKAVFEGLGYHVRFQQIDWSDKYDLLDSGEIDCVWNAFTCNVTDEDGIKRSEKIDFSHNYTDIRSVVVVHKDSGIRTAEDLEGKRGGAQKDSSAEWYSTYFDGTIVINYDNQAQCLTELTNGNADFAVLDELFAKEYIGNGDYSDLVILEDLTSDTEQFAAAFKKGSDLTDHVNKQLEKLGKDGTITKLAEKYGLQYIVVTDY